MYAGFVAVLTAALAIAPAAASAPGATAPTGHGARVVVIAVPDLRWADVEARFQAGEQSGPAINA